MNLYSNYVNYSVFDGEITLEKSAKNHILSTVFSLNTSNINITLIINNKRYNARLMNVTSSDSVQISYKNDVKTIFEQTFQYSYDYWNTIREEAKKANHSTRNLPIQTIERITISETAEPLVYLVECNSHFDSTNPYDKNNLESEETINFPEGKKVYANHVRYERNQGMIKLAKERFKSKNGALYCEACGFSFNIYGNRGKDFIEAHHDIPVSQLGNYGVSNIDDIKMVCSNCHRILHLKRPWLKVEDLKQLLTP